MMKLFSSILVTALLAFVFGIFFPWWTIAIAAFMVAIVVPQRPVVACFGGFLGVFLLWAGLALWIDVKNESILSRKVALIIPLGGSVFLLIIVTALLGGLVAGMAALSASYLRRPWRGIV